MNTPMIDFARMAGGAVQERLNVELRKLAENVLDPNTPATKARKLTITLTVKPDGNRDLGSLEIDTKLSIPSPTPLLTRLVFDRDGTGKAVTAELLSTHKDQLRFDDDGKVTDGVGEPVEQPNKVAKLFR